MMVFVTSLRHPANVKSMPVTLRLLETTLKSVLSQTDRDFRVVVVCNQKPQLSFEAPQVEFLHVDFEAPSENFGTLLKNYDAIRLDRGRKYLAALYHLKRLNPSHVMFFDADDLVSNRIAEIVNAGSAETSWCIDEGYVYSVGSPAIYKKKRHFHHLCGTCFIFKFDIFDLPQNISDVSDEWLKSNLGSHRLVHKYLAQKNVMLKNLPIPGAVYLINTGENHSAANGYLSIFAGSTPEKLLKLLAHLPRFERVTDRLRAEFGDIS